MKLRAIALDDEPISLEILKHYAEKVPHLVEIKAVFTGILQAKKYLEEEKVDLVFLDIHMPLISGIEFYRLWGKDRLLIFTTAHREFALEGFDMHAVDYLLKPFGFERFSHAVVKARRLYLGNMEEPRASDSILTLKSGLSTERINLSDVLYIRGMGDYLKVFLEDRKPVIIRMTMHSMVEAIDEGFVRIHRSYIVRLDKLTSIGPKCVKIKETVLPVGQKYKSAILK